jgi:triacylglycerol lipase
MGGFGAFTVLPTNDSTFDTVAKDLISNGEAAYVTLSPPFDSSEERAKAIAPQIDDILQRTGKAKVNIIAHSQGGLDARVLASPAGTGYGDRIASITTVSTPHRGSRTADVAMGLMQALPQGLVDRVTSSLLNILQKTVFDLQSDAHLRAQVMELSEQYMATVFNPKYVNDARVAYTSYAGRTNLKSGNGVCDDGVYPNDPKDRDPAQAFLIGTSAFLEDGFSNRVNDGLVTVESSKWGTFLQCIPADHFKEVGLFGVSALSFDHMEFYRTVVSRIHTAGF